MTAGNPYLDDPVYVELLATADEIDQGAAKLRTGSLSTQIISGAMQGAGAIVRARAHDRLIEMTSKT